MKNVFLGLALVTGSFAFGQLFGVKAGVNVSSLSVDNQLHKQEAKMGFNAGVFAYFPVGNEFSIQPELLYSTYGDKYTSGNASYSRNLNYVALPVMVQYNITPSLYAEFGPEFGYMISSNVKSVAGNNAVVTQKDSEKFNRFNIGLGIGGGYYFLPNFGITVRYNAGLTNINGANNMIGTAKYPDARNNVFQAGFAFKF